MPKQVHKGKRYGQKAQTLPFSEMNYILFAMGIGLLIFGYIALSIGPWDSVWSLTIAPILLVISYCIVIPLAILYHKKGKAGKTETETVEAETTE